MFPDFRYSRTFLKVKALILCSCTTKQDILRTAEEICDLIQQRYDTYEKAPDKIMNDIKKKYLHEKKLCVAADFLAPSTNDFCGIPNLF